MSQEKVDKYKAAKKTRKQDLEKEKKQKQLKRMIWIALGILAAAALLVGLVITGINMWKNKKQSTEGQYRVEEYVVTDMAGIQSTEAASQEAE